MPPLPRLIPLPLLLVALGLLLGPGARPVCAGYSLRTWQAEDGLPSSAVSCAVQTRDGYLWVGTYSGLARFDGKSFHVFTWTNTPALEDGRISALFEDEAGTLWIGHETGVITRLRNGSFESFTLRSGTAREKVTAIGSDEGGRIWAMRENGDIDAVEGSLRIPSLLVGEPPGIMSWNRGSRGEIWLSQNGKAARLQNQTLGVLPVATGSNPEYVLCVAPSAAGGAWLVCGEKDIRRWQDGSWVEARGPYPAPPGSVSCALELRDGTLALGTIYSGLYLLFSDGRPPQHFDQESGLPQNWVRFLYEDREGNLWAGTGSGGLVAVRKSPFSVLTPPDQWQGRTVISVAASARDGALWVGTEGGGLYRLHQDRWTLFGEREGLGNLYIWAVSEDRDGPLWVGNYFWGGPYQWKEGLFVRHPQLDTTSPPVLALTAGSAPGELLVGNREGLLRLTDSEAAWLYRSAPGTNADICAIVRDERGVTWFGSAQDGLRRLGPDGLTSFRRSDGLSSNAIQCLLVDHESGALWIGTADAGLSRFKDGHFTTIGARQGLVDEAISHLVEDDLGNVWLSTRRGLQRVSKAHLHLCADGALGWLPGQIYSRNHGLPTLEFSGAGQSAGTKTSDGVLMFTSSRGLVTVDPSRIETNPTPPPVIVESLIVDTEPLDVTGGALRVPLRPNHQRLEIHYTGLSFAAPDRVLFRYKLEGLEKDWVHAGDLRTAFYSRLPAGSYRFRVLACNGDGVWNEEGAVLTFTVAPFFWQTWWFLGLAAATTLSAVALLVRFFTRRRMLRRVEHLERLHAIDRERARIARDIHDDLGGSLTHIALLSQSAGEPREGTLAAQVLSGIQSSARDGIRALDEIVWAVDPQQDTLDSLVSYMGKYAQDFLEAARITCRLHLPLDLPPWPLGAELRHNLFLAFKEALNNTLKHAAATEVRISVLLENRGFRLVIQDNGRGFDRGSPPSPESGRIAGGHGLSNLERRLALIGGRCHIKSSPASGTEVSLIVSLPAEETRLAHGLDTP